MKLNESNTDRIIRVVLAVVFFVLAFGPLSGIWAVVAGVLGVVMLGTAAVGFCPLYALFGINTCPVDQRKA
ncbi:MAG: DUF2892 domain-containing protein [Meiothermus sp.]|nr:DUF2892 domain-containing protein [Meiothermus sp.]